MWPPSSTGLIADSQLPSALLIPDGPRATIDRLGSEGDLSILGRPVVIDTNVP